MKLLLLGPPGGGKGTQASYLIKTLYIPQISTGDMLRGHLKNNSFLGRKAKKYMTSGELVPDQIILDMMKNRLQKSDCISGYILDGFPRTIPQAEGLDLLLKSLNQTLDFVIVINVNDNAIIERMSGRRFHLSSGRSYHIIYNPPKTKNKDDKTGEDLITREDDQKETVIKRLQVYHMETKPLIDYYSNKNILHTIDGEQSIENVKYNILNALNIS